jgi:hypothetical protein
MHQEAVANVEEVVAAGAFDGPVGTEEFAGLENLLAYDPGFGSIFSKTGEILERIAQAVGVVDAYTVEDAFVQPLKDAAMGGVEDMRSLDANSDKSVDVEEATIAEFLVSGAPVGETIVLLVQDFVEVIMIGVEFGDDVINCC